MDVFSMELLDLFFHSLSMSFLYPMFTIPLFCFSLLERLINHSCQSAGFLFFLFSSNSSHQNAHTWNLEVFDQCIINFLWIVKNTKKKQETNIYINRHKGIHCGITTWEIQAYMVLLQTSSDTFARLLYLKISSWVWNHLCLINVVLFCLFFLPKCAFVMKISLKFNCLRIALFYN